MGKLTNLNPSKVLTETDMPPGMATDAETTAAINAHTGAADPHTQYLLQSEGDARYRQISVLLTDSDIPSGVARKAEVTAAINAHTGAVDPHTQYLLQSEGDARYFRGISQLFTLDPPSIGAGTLYKVFYTINGANVGDFCSIVPVNMNLYTTAAWPFVFAAVVEAANTVGVYLRNDTTTAIDLASFQIRILVINF
jgi:hypothetical protein